MLVALVHDLDPDGRPTIRIGGQGADRTWWPVAGMRRPLGVSDTLSPRFTETARRLAVAIGARYQLQVNLEADSTRLAAVEADHLVSGIGRARIAALEIGNEPDLYKRIPWYWESDGRPLPWYANRGAPRFARSPGYGPAQFAAQARRFARVLPPGIPLAGPDLVTPKWFGDFARLMTGHSRVQILDAHAYPLITCTTDPANPTFPSITHLLALRASRHLLAGTGPYIAQAHRDGGRFVVDELGSDSCGGTPGVDDTLASALWAVDALFSMDRAGVDEVDLHTLPGAVNGLLDLSDSHGRWRAKIRPLYLGALLFAQAAPSGSRLLSLSGGGQATLRTWATIAPDHLIRVVLINEGGPTSATIRAPAGFRSLPAEVERLRGPSAAATGGIRFAGRRFAETSTGVLPRRAPQIVAPRAGAYRVAMGAASAALVTLAPRRGR